MSASNALALPPTLTAALAARAAPHCLSRWCCLSRPARSLTINNVLAAVPTTAAVGNTRIKRRRPAPCFLGAEHRAVFSNCRCLSGSTYKQIMMMLMSLCSLPHCLSQERQGSERTTALGSITRCHSQTINHLSLGVLCLLFLCGRPDVLSGVLSLHIHITQYAAVSQPPHERLADASSRRDRPRQFAALGHL